MNTHSFYLTQAITFFSALSLVSAFGMLSLRTLRLCIRTYAAQSLCLGFTAFLLGLSLRHYHVAIIAMVVMIVKGLLIPWFLDKVMEEVRIKRELDPFVSYPISMFIGVGLALVSYSLVDRVIMNDPFAAKGFSLALTLILLGLWLMVSRKKAMIQVLGLLVVENGLFVAALSTSFSMPMIVELGLVFDLLIAVVIMGMLIFRIQNTFSSINTEHLNRLKG
ncbi:MAG: hypothetical protein A3I11_04880 [Elusimicrobia bacterium RIFCSPLOWO2_02_FULL_39_32]|nr:MAG: hypothetical protein A2034_07835 [Elusimicrobia bacterium GWA2_38_7]OGR80112.1 MAG: hypothetical protein A3B80_00725 [Elusimicrobia bacterium RIFCSPHIGHO2_02_FULL_39_36]OGR91093.1 MAG: hypothetical protein A3I11_04880 [Elusimicrobia bacterium RIFCSPLOWO2_02_FULL_39_32]OGS00060.1 MAG: hypothetical protein A3G85_07845 [Elusimicrobia bacterium RIFCSPLOWO2_12_FULL_39_28]